MTLAIFDLDETIINGDCVDYWLKYSIDRRIIDQPGFHQKNLRYLMEYEQGSMDIYITTWNFVCSHSVVSHSQT